MLVKAKLCLAFSFHARYIPLPYHPPLLPAPKRASASKGYLTLARPGMRRVLLLGYQPARSLKIIRL